MSPQEDAEVRRLLESKLDMLHDTLKTDTVETRGQLNRIETQVRNTNGRVTAIELREAAVKAALEERRRLADVQQGVDDRRHESNAKWIGVVPTVIASVVSGVTVSVVLLLITHTVTL